MAYFPSEIADPPTGYPTGGPVGSAFYPNMPAQGSTTNPSGVANTPDEFPAVVADPPTEPYAYAYSWQTWEEKNAAMVPPGVPVVPVAVAANEPYPTS